MSRIAPALMSSASPRAITQGQPGSNGYWRRQIWDRPGTYTWTATKDGKVKVQAIGAASGASNAFNGNPGHYGDKVLNVLAGQTLTIVVGEGGIGSGNAALSGSGGATSISGTPVGGTPLVLPGAPGVQANSNNVGTPTFPSGPWDRSFAGGVQSNFNWSRGYGGAASASPFGPGVHTDQQSVNTGGRGGHGWGGQSAVGSGASSHRRGIKDASASAWGRVARGGLLTQSLPEALPFWDLEDVDSGGGYAPPTTNAPSTGAGPGAGGAVGANYGSTSTLGGGTAYQSETNPPQGGNGAGGIGSTNDSNAGTLGGKGGNGYVQIFWDEVA